MDDQSQIPDGYILSKLCHHGNKIQTQIQRGPNQFLLMLSPKVKQSASHKGSVKVCLI
jgi:hypothetical protein